MLSPRDGPCASGNHLPVNRLNQFFTLPGPDWGARSRKLASRGVKAFDLDQLAARALDHETNNLVALLHDLDVGSGRRRLNDSGHLEGDPVVVRGAQPLGFEGLSAL